MEKVYQATGKRKTSIATVYLKAGEGKITINENGIDDYFGRETSKMVVHQPLELTNNTGKFDISINVTGGGISGQAGAIRHGITKALLIFNPELRKTLKSAGYITRDPRSKERKKYGLAAARKRYQFSKR